MKYENYEIFVRRAETPELQADFKALMARSHDNPKEAMFLGQGNWDVYLADLLSSEEEMADTCYVGYLEDEPIGFVVASPNETDHIYLSEVYVTPETRGMNAARSMLSTVLKMNDAAHIHAYVHEKNIAMQRLLESIGGRAAGKWYDYIV